MEDNRRILIKIYFTIFLMILASLIAVLVLKNDRITGLAVLSGSPVFFVLEDKLCNI